MGKRIFAVVAGVGLVTAGLTVVAPGANAGPGDREPCGTGKAAERPDPTAANQLAKSKCDDEVTAGRFVEGTIEVQSTKTYYEGEELWRETVMSAIVAGDPVNPPDPGGNGGDSLEELVEGVVDMPPPPPPCWASNNCPVGNAIRTSVPQYMIAGTPQTLLVYASWRPDPNSPAQPTNGDAVIYMDEDPVAAAPFVDGVATFNFTPVIPGMKDVRISGVLNSNTGGANAWIDTVEAATMVLPYDPELYEKALKNKKVEVGQTYTLQEIAQAKTALGKRLEWRVAQDSSDVCAVTTTKKGEVKAKFTESGKCSIIWTDPKTDEEGKYTFKVTA